MHPLALTGIVAAVAIVLMIQSLYAHWRGGDRLALPYAATLVCWLALLASNYWIDSGGLTGDGRALTRVLYQVTVLSVTAFLLLAMHGFFGLKRALTLLQAVLGTVLALTDAMHEAWFWVNALLSSGLLLLLAQAIWRRPSSQGWMGLLVGISGVGVMVTDLREAADGPIMISTSHYFFVVALFVLRMALMPRASVEATVRTQPAAQERQRLAQELHDGVGSHLASIISALDLGTAQQRETAASLQHCMAELKLLVDGMDADASLLSHLASLRYRMQPLLAAAGIDLEWQIADEPALESVQGDAALQFLRLAQEALANVVRHSGANRVVLTCCHVKAQQALMLEVADNGVGMPTGLRTVHPDTFSEGESLGKGMRSMARRAARLGGLLVVEGVHGQGTRIRLLVPMARPARS